MSSTSEITAQSSFKSAYEGRMFGILRWTDLDQLWAQIKAHAGEGWFIYAVGEPPPKQPAEASKILSFINEIDALLRREHAYDYCGIVYTDDPKSPQLVKIFDPNHLGSSCGSSGAVTPPGWVLSRMRPDDLANAMPLANNRRRWWERLFNA